MTDRVVLVTGGAGYIGSHVCQSLAAAGWCPVTYDNLIMGCADAVHWGPLVVGDICDRASLDAAITAWRPEAVMHFAARAYVGESVTDPALYYRNNVTGSLTLLEAMRDHGVSRMIFSSSCATYGIPPHDDEIDENTPQSPINPYGASKLMVERILADFGSAYGISSIALRYFNAAGSDPKGVIGENHDPETHLIPLAIETALGLRRHLTIHGVDYPTPDGTCIRDYVHVNDLASAHILALQVLDTRQGYVDAFNLGIGRGFSVRDIISSVERISQKSLPVVAGARRMGDPARLISNAERARTILGWEPKFTHLDLMIETAWNWKKARLTQSS